ncbi:MAG TPA: Gfo/Idh/MocA family oxidoreductase [Chthoniobacteraceae bacterium]|nr:Gfo/Idh/MocA family oxidoreductase [Chthoniobacteraceae bacterium]
MNKVNLGLIGCGGLGNVHAECISRIGKAAFLAYADVKSDRAKALLSRFGGEYYTCDVERVLSDPRIDAVYICTQHDSHAPLAIAAAGVGKHIFIEKPLALTAQDCEAIALAVEASGVSLMPAFKMRYYPLIQRAREFIPEPALVVGQMMDRRWEDSYWAQDPDKGGGNVYSQGCHTADIIRFLSGCEPLALRASGGNLTHPGHERIDHCVASIEMENGSLASWIQGDAALGMFTGKVFFEVFGDGKSVQIYDRMKKAVFHDGEATWTEERAMEEGFFLENVEFITALIEGRPPGVTVFDGLQAARIVFGASESIATGAAFHFPSSSTGRSTTNRTASHV